MTHNSVEIGLVWLEAPENDRLLNMAIIVTGGAGFIGSAFVRFLNDRGCSDIYIVDNLASSDKWRNLVGKKFIEYFHKEEFLKLVNDNAVPGKPHILVHLGACSSTSERNVDYLMQNNVKYSQALAQFALRNRMRFIYASSAATYGDGAQGYSDTGDIEGFRPLNPYGFSKQLFDRWVIQNHLSSRTLGIKFFNVFGPNEYHKGTMISGVYRAWQQIKASGSIQLFRSLDSKQFADGEQKRDFIYVRDCCEMLYQLLERHEVTGLLNFGTGEARSWNDMAKAVAASLNKPLKIEYVETPEHLRNGYQNYTQADVRRLHEVLPAFKTTSLELAAADYVKNFLVPGQLTL